MLGKLALLRAIRSEESPDKLLRDEVRQIVVDTELLLTDAVSMDDFRDGKRDRKRGR